MSFATLSIIDLKSDESTIVRSIFEACLTTGFFYLRNHNLREAQNHMFSLTKEYFQLPMDIKNKHMINHNNFGFLGLGQEILDTAKEVKQLEEKETFHFTKGIQSSELPSLFGQQDNYLLISNFHRDCYDLSMQLLTYLAKSLEISHDYFTLRHKWDMETNEILRLAHYPAICKTSTFDKPSIRAGAHSDFGSITFVFQHDQQGGLEVLDRSTNIWYPVEAHDDMIVVNFGDVSEYWSRGLIKSSVHRVVTPVTDTDNERFSIIYFAYPNLSEPLTSIPSKFIENRQFIKDAHTQHVLDHKNEEVLTAGEYLQMRLNKVQPHRQNITLE